MSGLVQFAGSLGSRVLAEGVETIEQMEALRSLGIDLVQGYLMGRPRPAEEQAIAAWNVDPDASPARVPCEAT